MRKVNQSIFMRRTFWVWVLLLPLFSHAQNLPACDSLVINCCAFDSLGANSLTIFVSNPSSELFDYPGFVLLDTEMDTIAKETVNYFGIGTGFQPHTMNIISPLNLPFTGYLNLYTLFYQEFACSFPFMIADTVTTVTEIKPAGSVMVFPNPCTNELHVERSASSSHEEVLLTISDVTGKEVLTADKQPLPATLSLNGVAPGLYILQIRSINNRLIECQKVMVLE